MEQTYDVQGEVVRARKRHLLLVEFSGLAAVEVTAGVDDGDAVVENIAIMMVIMTIIRDTRQQKALKSMKCNKYQASAAVLAAIMTTTKGNNDNHASRGP